MERVDYKFIINRKLGFFKLGEIVYVCSAHVKLKMLPELSQQVNPWGCCYCVRLADTLYVE